MYLHSCTETWRNIFFFIIITIYMYPLPNNVHIANILDLLKIVTSAGFFCIKHKGFFLRSSLSFDRSFNTLPQPKRVVYLSLLKSHFILMQLKYYKKQPVSLVEDSAKLPKRNGNIQEIVWLYWPCQINFVSMRQIFTTVRIPFLKKATHWSHFSVLSMLWHQ